MLYESFTLPDWIKVIGLVIIVGGCLLYTWWDIMRHLRDDD